MAQFRPGLFPLLAIAAATFATLAGCSKSPSPEHKSEAPAPAVNVEWTKFVDEFIEAYFVANPAFAVYSGRHEFDGQIGDEHFHLSAGLVVQFGAQALQPVGVTGDQYQVVAVDGVAAGESSAEPRRRSSDQCDGAWHALEST